MWQRGFHAASSPSSSDVYRRFYKPLILQTPGLLLILTIALALVGILEYAARTLPLADNRPYKQYTPNTSKFVRLLHRRQDGSSGTKSTLCTHSSRSSIEAASSVISIQNADPGFLHIATTSTAAIFGVQARAVSLNSNASTSTITALESANPDSYLASASTVTRKTPPSESSAVATQPISTTSTTPTTNPDAYMPTSSVSTNKAAPSASVSVASSISSAQSVIYTTNPSAYAQIQSTSTQQPKQSSTTASSSASTSNPVESATTQSSAYLATDISYLPTISTSTSKHEQAATTSPSVETAGNSGMKTVLDTMPPSAYLPIVSTSTSKHNPTETTIGGSYLPTVSTSTSKHVQAESTSPSADSGITTGFETMPPNAYLPTVSTSTSKPDPTETTIGGSYLPTVSTSTSKHVQAESTSPSADAASDSSTTLKYITGQNAYLSTDSTLKQGATQTPTATPSKNTAPDSESSSSVASFTTSFLSNPQNAYLATDSTLTTPPAGTTTEHYTTRPQSAYLGTVTQVLVNTILSTDASGHVQTSLSSYTTTQTLPKPIGSTVAYSTNGYLPTVTRVHVSTAFSTDASGHVQTILSTYTTTQASTSPTPAESAPSSLYLATFAQVLVSTITYTDASGQVRTSLSSYTTSETLQMSAQTGTSTVVTTDSAGHTITTAVPYTTLIPALFAPSKAYLTTVAQVLVSTIVYTDASGQVRTSLSSYTTTETLQMSTQTGTSTFVTTDSAGHTITAAIPYTTLIPGLFAHSKAYLTTAARVLVSTILSTDASGQVRTSLSSYTTAQTLQMTTQTGASTIVATDSAGHTITTAIPYTTVVPALKESALSSPYLTTAVQVLISTILSTDASGQVRTSLSSYTTTQTLQMTTQTGTSTIITTDSVGHTKTTAIPYTTVGLVQSTQGSSSSSSNSTKDQTPEAETVLITWPLWWVFIAGYLPILLAILIKIYWASIYANVKLMEPFIQLSKPDGTLASSTLHSFYLSGNLTPDPILALFQGRWLIFLTSSVYLIVGLLAPLSSEVLFLDIHYDCGAARCWPPRLSADGAILRILQGLLAFIALMALIIMIMMYRSTTGVYSNPSSIASIAALLHHPEVLDDFRNLDDNLSSKEMKRELGNKRYQMGMYKRPDGVWRYGIVPASQTYSPGWTQVPLNQKTTPSKPAKKRTHHISTALDIVFSIFIFGLLGVVIAYYLDGSDSGFNRFFNSNAFGPRFFMSFLGTLIAMYWKRLERKVQTLTPFHRLTRSPAPAKTSILFRRYSLPPLVFTTSLLSGHIFASLIALITILADILTIALAIVPYSPTEIYIELLVSCYTSIAILSLMVLVLIAYLFWKRKLREMPRKPDTLAGVISYLCDSQFLGELEGCEGLRTSELEKRIGREGKRYGFGRYLGVDGKKRWMVEEEGVVL